MPIPFTENQLCKLWFEDDVAYCEFKLKKIDVEAAQSLISLRHRFFDGKAHVTLIDIRTVKSITKEARDLFASKEGTVNINAAALFGHSSLSNMLATFFLNFNRPNVPIKLFKERDEAIQWLNKYKG